jgi:hypothetical protein
VDVVYKHIKQNHELRVASGHTDFVQNMPNDRLHLLATVAVQKYAFARLHFALTIFLADDTLQTGPVINCQQWGEAVLVIVQGCRVQNLL